MSVNLNHQLHIIDAELFESVRCLVNSTYTSLVARHTIANQNGSDLNMDDLDELMAYCFLFNEVSYETFINEEGFNNKLSNANILTVQTRVYELNKPANNRQNF